MRRYTSLVVLLFCSYGLFAQLSLRRSAGEELLPIGQPSLETGGRFVGGFKSVSAGDSLFSRAPAPYAFAGRPSTSASFDYAQSKPYLAFFCRLELNIEEATRFPVRFRLGEVRTWQQELSKRD